MVQRNRILKKYVMRVTYFNENILCEMGEMILDGNKVRNEGDDRGNKVRNGRDDRVCKRREEMKVEMIVKFT